MRPFADLRLGRLAACAAALTLVGAACTQATTPTPTPTATNRAPAASPAASPAPAAPGASPASGSPAASPAASSAAQPAASPVASPAAKPAAAPMASPAAKPAASPMAAPAGQQGGNLRSATLGGAPRTLHPYPEATGYTTPWADAATLIWAGLISIDYDALEWRADPRQDIAREMPRVSDDNRTYTFTIRDDARWSDGQPITSADFQYAWDQASKPENNWIGLTSTVARIESFRTPDERTVEVTLKEPLARFLALSIVNGITPVPRQVWENRSWSDPGANPEVLKPTVVSGPYMPQEIGAEAHSYTRNPSYFGKQPNLDQITFVNSSPQTVLELLRTQQVEWAQSYPPSQFEESKQIPHANVLQWTGAAGSYRVVQFNLQRPLLADKRVREALVRVIDRADLVELEDNLGDPQYGLLTQNSRWRNEEVERYEYDLDRARQLLQEAGYRLEDGRLVGPDNQPVTFEILWPTTSQPRGKMATYWQQQLGQLGIDVTVTGLEFNAFVERYQGQKDFDIVMGSFSSTLDPDSIKSQLETGGTQNAGGYSNPRVDQLFREGAMEQDEQRRKEIYDEIQRIAINEDLVQFPLLTLQNFTAFDRRVQNVRSLRGGDILRQNNLQVIDWSLEPR